MVSWVSSGITALRLRYLKTIDDICRKDSMGLVVPMDVEAEMGLNPKLAKVMMKRLRDMGWLERPYRGCYRLADKGRKIMKEAKGK